MQVQRWDVLEITVNGPKEGNPFVEQSFEGTFVGKNETVQDDRIPMTAIGSTRCASCLRLKGNTPTRLPVPFPRRKLLGGFTVTPATGNNHGPVRVAGTHHLAYEDGTPYYSVGTTCYVWPHQSDEVIAKTLKELDKGYFNKMRFCVFPKHYIHNFRDPQTFPYEGTPMDASGLTRRTSPTRWTSPKITGISPISIRSTSAASNARSWPCGIAASKPT